MAGPICRSRLTRSTLRAKRQAPIDPGLMILIAVCAPQAMPLPAIGFVAFSGAALTDPPIVNAAEPVCDPTHTIVEKQPLLARSAVWVMPTILLNLRATPSASLPWLPVYLGQIHLGQTEDAGSSCGGWTVDQQIKPADPCEDFPGCIRTTQISWCQWHDDRDGILAVVRNFPQHPRIAGSKTKIHGLPGKFSCDCCSDSAASAGYQRNFPAMAEFHSLTLRFLAGNLAWAADHGKDESIL